MRVLGIVPARGGSRRMPGKNLAEVGGRTLVRRALDAAVASGRLDPVVLSSDDAAILAEAADRVERAHPELAGGVGIYRANRAHGPFVHIDVRGARARWGHA